jgi:hypothetical protein
MESPFCREKRGKAGEGRIDQFLDSSFRNPSQFRNDDSQKIEGKSDRFAVKVTAIEDLSLIGKDEGIVRGRIDLDFKRLSSKGQGIPDGAVNLRDTPEGIGILYF